MNYDTFTSFNTRFLQDFQDLCAYIIKKKKKRYQTKNPVLLEWNNKINLVKNPQKGGINMQKLVKNVSLAAIVFMLLGVNSYSQNRSSSFFVDTANVYPQDENSDYFFIDTANPNRFVYLVVNSTLFQQAFNKEDSAFVIRTTISGLLVPQKKCFICPNKPSKSGLYWVLYADDRYIYKGRIKKNNELYTKYNPIKDSNDEMQSAKIKGKKKLFCWAKQEIDKGLMVSVIAKNRTTYYVKSYSIVL